MYSTVCTKDYIVCFDIPRKMGYIYITHYIKNYVVFGCVLCGIFVG